MFPVSYPCAFCILPAIKHLPDRGYYVGDLCPRAHAEAQLQTRAMAINLWVWSNCLMVRS